MLYLYIIIYQKGVFVEKQDFAELLKKAGLNRKEFVAMLDVEYTTVLGWGSVGKPFPYWVESWLENYIKAKHFDDAKKIFCKDSN